MGRPREFVEEDALDAAVEVFRRSGYKGTSMEDLITAMGISRSSCYDSFGDKHHLFLRAFDRYAKSRRDNLCRILEQDGPRKPLIRRHFEDVIDDALLHPSTGCLIVSSAVEFASENPSMAPRLKESFELMENLFTEALREAQENGEIGAGHDTRALSRYLVASVRGLRLTARITKDREVLRQIVDVTLSVLS